ncbi:DUF7282 domain-containing protein [Haloglomus salinum]|uniref:DUF7282 domain-containing protein n=1 Tax=Haloglomus salinum TaxID=2962673 RepID=UPI0020C9B099|nr:BGTF surface domain-containing protein [Haloglomus salinum]
MTGTHEKLRGITLAVLMVVSVFAGTIALSGSAVALQSGNFDNGNANAEQTSELIAQATWESTDNNGFQEYQVDFSGASGFDGDFGRVDDAEVEIVVYDATVAPGNIKATSADDGGTYDPAGATDLDEATVSGLSNEGDTIKVGLPSAYNNLDADDIIELRIADNQFQNPSTQGTYEGTIDLDPQSSSAFDEVTADLDVDEETDSVSGDDEAAAPGTGADDVWDDQATRYQGQDLFFAVTSSYEEGQSSPEGGSIDYQLRSVSGFDSTTGGYDSSSLERDITLDTDGPSAPDGSGISSGDYSASTLIDTSDLEGNYVITDGQGNYVETEGTAGIVDANADFITQTEASSSGAGEGDQSTEIVVQTLDTEFDEDSVASGDTVDIDFDSPVRSGYQVEVEADGLDQDDLFRIFDGSGVADLEPDSDSTDGTESVRDENITFTVTDTDFTAEADFSEIDTGDYDFTFNVTDSSAQDTASITVNEEDDIDATFARNAIVQQRGDVVGVSVALEETDTVTVVFGNSSDVNFEQKVRIRDDDDNDRVNFSFNTYLAGGVADQDASAAFNTEDDLIVGATIADGVPDDEPLEAGDYDLSARVDTDGDSSTPPVEQDLSVLTLEERSTDSAAVYSAPTGAAGSYDDAEDLRSDIVQSDAVAQNDLVVLQANVSGVFGYPNDAGDDYLGNEDSAPFGDYLKQGDESDELSYTASELSRLGVSLALQEEGPNADADSLNIGGATVYPDQDNDTMYIVFDSREINLEDGETYNASFAVPEDNFYVDDDDSGEDEAEVVSDTFEYEERELTFDTNEQGIITVEAAEGQTITGTTNLAPNTEITVRARASGEGAFLKTADVDVLADGTFNATLDFSDVPSNTSFTATVPGQGLEDNAETPGQVGSAQVGAATFSNQTFTGQATSVNVESVTVSEGGFVTIHDSTLVSDGAVFDSVRGTSEYLEEGTTENVTVELDSPIAPSGSGTYYAMPHLDSDGDETYDFVTSEGADDGPYVDGEGNPVTDAATITVERVATVTLNDQTTSGDNVLVESARLPDGGFVTIHDATVSDDPFGSVRGTSAYLDSGTSADINVSLDTPVEESGQFFAMPHRDTDGDETYDFVSSNGDDDGPYLNADGQIVLDSGQISLAGEMTPTPTEADEPTPTPTEADEPTPTDGEETTTTSSDGQPGFGLAVSLIALVGAALIALRRRD